LEGIKIKQILKRLIASTGYTLMKSTSSEYLTGLPELIHNQIVQNSKGVLHIGGHLAEERHKYDSLHVPVIWIEGIHEYYIQLVDLIRPFPNQSALCYFLSDKTTDQVPFYLANNDRASSSLFQLSENSGFPGLIMDDKILVKTHRFDGVVDSKFLEDFNHIVVDVQGAELKVLQGFGDLLYCVNSMRLEVSTYEVYKGGSTYVEIKDYLFAYGFYPLWEPRSHSHVDVIFLRKT